jgi:hypothetical protein
MYDPKKFKKHALVNAKNITANKKEVRTDQNTSINKKL